MFVYSSPLDELPVDHDQDVWKSAGESSDFFAKAEHVATDELSTYCAARSLSEWCEDARLLKTPSANASCSAEQTSIENSSVCLSDVKSVKPKLPIALMVAPQSSMMLSTLTLQSSSELDACGFASDARVSDVHATQLPSSSADTVCVCYL